MQSATRHQVPPTPTHATSVFDCNLIPLAIAELYFRAEKGHRARQFTAAGVLALCAAFTLLGTFGAFSLMWLPHF